jgi:glycerol-1-phosphate dehydrogenase [NAD(P)+]
LQLYGQQGRLQCRCGKAHALQTRRIILDNGALDRLPELLENRYGSRMKTWVLSDEHTERAAGQRCKQLLSRSSSAGTVLPSTPRLRTTPEVTRRLCEQAGSADLILAVGGGTISDIAKLVSRTLGIPNWCVVTAPSVDAFTSGTSAMKLSYRHKSEPARPAEVILADLEVLERAPQQMFLAGVGDLLAKYLSYLDWRLAALIIGEYICEQTAVLCLDSARQALRAMETLSTDRRAAVRSLTDATLLSGLAMQALSNSRPASSAEHTIAHYWELAHIVGNPTLELHGLLVGVSSRILLPVYRELYANPALWRFDLEDRLRQLQEEADWEQELSPSVRPFEVQMREEMEGGAPGPAAYRKRLENARNHRKELSELAGGLLDELENAVAVLAGLAFPFQLSDYRLDPQQALVPLRYVRFLRNRYSSFNLIHELGAGERLIELAEREAQLLG